MFAPDAGLPPLVLVAREICRAPVAYTVEPRVKHAAAAQTTRRAASGRAASLSEPQPDYRGSVAELAFGREVRKGWP
jgi:hypothetical protein